MNVFKNQIIIKCYYSFMWFCEGEGDGRGQGGVGGEGFCLRAFFPSSSAFNHPVCRRGQR